MTFLTWMVAGAGGIACVVLYRARQAARAEVQRLDVVRQQLEVDLARERQERERLRSTLLGLGQGVVLLDADYRIVDWNPAAASFAELPDRRGGTHSLEEAMPWTQLRGALDQLQAAAAPPPAVEFEHVEATGAERYLLVSVQRLGGHGYAVVIRDESRIRRLESMRRDFVANVSHELKTPLAAIKGFVETLRDDAEMPEATRSRFLERISSQSERLNSLVGDLLTLSRLDETAGGADRFQPCDLAVITGETVRDLRSLAERKSIELTLDAPDGRLFVRADREGLRQVVGNLVDNAIKYTPENGSVAVRLEQTREHVRLQVADTGIGLAPEDQERVFERFYRVDRARSRELGGTGLGLSIVKNTVRSFGGTVAVQSSVGRGTMFWVTLPRLPTEP